MDLITDKLILWFANEMFQKLLILADNYEWMTRHLKGEQYV